MDQYQSRTVSRVLVREMCKLNGHLPTYITNHFRLAIIHLIDRKMSRIGYQIDVDNMSMFFDGLDRQVDNQEYTYELKESMELIERSHIAYTHNQPTSTHTALNPILDFVDAINEEVCRFSKTRIFVTEVLLILSALYQDDTLTFVDVCNAFRSHHHEEGYEPEPGDEA